MVAARGSGVRMRASVELGAARGSARLTLAARAASKVLASDLGGEVLGGPTPECRSGTGLRSCVQIFPRDLARGSSRAWRRLLSGWLRVQGMAAAGSLYEWLGHER